VFNLSRLLDAVERRARRLRGLRLAGVVLAVGGAAALAITAADRFGLLSLHRPALGGVIALPLFCSLVTFLCVRRSKAPLPQLLLRIDQVLGTSERLSALHELRQRGGRDVFRRRIESRLPDGSLPWKQGLPVGPSHWGPLAAGGLLLVGACLLVGFAPRPSDVVAAPLSAQTRTPTEGRAAAMVPESTAPTLPQQTQAPPTGRLEHAEPPPPESLEDVLSDIWGTPTTGGAVLSEANPSCELVEQQQQRTQALEELLSRLEEQLQQDQREGLTEEERHTLRQMLPDVTDPQLRQALENLVEETDPEALREHLEQALGLTRAMARSQADQSAEQQEKIRPTPEDVEKSEAALDWTPPGTQEETTADGEQTARGTAGEGEDDDASDQSGPGHGEEDIDSRGGTDGIPGGASPTEQQPGFVPTDLAAKVGSKGEFNEFLTKGVPLELDASQGEEDLYVVDYETLRAILEGRLLPPASQDVVKRYFETITRGGP